MFAKRQPPRRLQWRRSGGKPSAFAGRRAGNKNRLFPVSISNRLFIFGRFCLVLAVAIVLEDYMYDVLQKVYFDEEEREALSTDSELAIPYAYLNFYILISGILGSAVCYYYSRMLRLKAWRFLFCGFALMSLTLAFLSIYTALKNEKNERRYNYYGLSLGLTFFILVSMGYLINLFFLIKWGYYAGS